MTKTEEQLLYAVSLLTQILNNDNESYGLDSELRADIINFIHSDFEQLNNKVVNSDLFEQKEKVLLDRLSEL